MRPEHERGAAGSLPTRLLRLHRRSRANLLVLGGTPERRLAIARAFHHGSPLAGAGLAVLDCDRDQLRLTRALERWLLVGAAPEPGESLERAGVLFLDHVGALSDWAQRLLLMVTHRREAGGGGARAPGPARLMAGDRQDLLRAAQTGRFSPALVDLLDKIRVDLGRGRSRGVA